MLCLAVLLSANIHFNFAWTCDVFSVRDNGINANFLECEQEAFGVGGRLSGTNDDGYKPWLRRFYHVPERHVIGENGKARCFKQRPYFFRESDGFGYQSRVLNRNRAFSGFTEKGNESITLLGSESSGREALGQFCGLELCLFEFDLRSLESLLRLNFVGALNDEQFVRDVVATERKDDTQSRNDQADPTEDASQTLEFISAHWQLLLSFTALLYSAYVFGYTGAAIRASKVRHNVSHNRRAFFARPS